MSLLPNMKEEALHMPDELFCDGLPLQSTKSSALKSSSFEFKGKMSISLWRLLESWSVLSCGILDGLSRLIIVVGPWAI